jgi:hypothetical protein
MYITSIDKLGLTLNTAMLPIPILQMRFPMLVATHGVLVLFNLCFSHICGDTGLRWVMLTVLPRAAAFTIGMASDMARRRAFMREQLHVE